MNFSTLSNICSFVSEKTKVSNLSLNNYISTENMLPNKGGVALSSSLPPTVQTQSFNVGDVLISNIRPYFKKIWLAEEHGGCSNDILVLRAKPNTIPEFLYYVLANDSFFDYSMQTAKGTKMPRGDKKAMMLYEVPCVDIETQRDVSRILLSIDKKIKLNNQINDNLVA